MPSTYSQRYKYRHQCKTCGAFFYSHHKHSKNCSIECRGKALHRRVEKICKGCGKTFEVIPSEGYRVYCNRECWLNSHKSKSFQEAKADLVLSLGTLLEFGYQVKVCESCGCVLPPTYPDELCEKCNSGLTS